MMVLLDYLERSMKDEEVRGRGGEVAENSEAKSIYSGS